MRDAFSVRINFNGVPHLLPAELTFTYPEQIIVATTVEEVIPALKQIEAAAADGKWCAGWITYEAAPAFDSAMPAATPDAPLVWFGIYGAPCLPTYSDHTSDLQAMEWCPAIQRDRYDNAITSIRDAIERGDVYQANFTFALNSHTSCPPEAIYNRLVAQSACGYAALIKTDEISVLSLSPELFFSIQKNADTGERTITTRPMKGTRTRGRFALEDTALKNELLASEKDRAENIMIVDLLRNDLGRVAQFGTVQVDTLFDIEPYPTVWQMTSSISAELRPEAGLTDVFRALFPCGSVTGAPKIASMRLLNALEQGPRGPYCGAIGVVKPGGEAVFNVAIRTMTIDGEGNACYRVGGGITYDSGAEAEYQEALAKAAVVADLAPDFELIETFRIENGHVAHLEAHLDRIAVSAAALGFRFDSESVELTIGAVATLHAEGCKRARLRLNRAGEAIVEASALVDHPANPRFRLAKHSVNSADRFLFHKTTRRAVYESAAADYPDCWEVLLWNENGELTEFTRGNLVLELGGQKRTPTLRCGLLPGVLRSELLAKGDISEAILTPGHLAAASRIWFINSLRGWIEIRPEGILPA